MKKDTIYIDAEDDITAIVGKVKTSTNKVIALVPPKRIGILQSAVNLRLLARVAEQNGKRLVLVTGNQALTNLAAMAGIPSARTLQSKPVLPPVPVEDDSQDEEIIEGGELAVGDHAGPVGDSPRQGTSALAAAAVESTIRDNVAEGSKVSSDETRTKNRVKIPNFSSFRKRLAIIVVAVGALAGFLVWAIMFAPQADIIVTARTIKSSANVSVSLPISEGETSLGDSTLKPTMQTVQKEVSVKFEATGTKDVGDRAEGEVVFYNCASPSSVTVSAGTGISSGGKTYITQEAATVPAGEGNWISGCLPGQSVSVGIVAQDIGADFNVSEGTQFSVAGHPSLSGNAYFRATAVTDIDGGSSREVKVPTDDDISEATDKLKEQDESAIKKELLGKFGDDVAVLEGSLRIRVSGVKSNPAADKEAEDGEAELTGTVAYSMLGVERSEISEFLDDHFAKELEEANGQQIYDNGAKSASFVDIMYSDRDGHTATLVATAQFGPEIDEDALREDARGKRYGEVQSELMQISGVENVEINLSPFWVNSIPRDESRISIEFKLNESE